MREVLALAAFGLLINASFFMTFFWGRIAVRRLKFLKYKGILEDRYAVLSSCLTASSMGTAFYFGAHAYRGIVYDDIPSALPFTSSYFLLIGLFIIACSKAGFVWAVHCDMKSVIWRIFLALSGVWVLITVFWDTFFN